ncbi:MAG: Ig-like domain-containing protein [Acidimicrobiales bacterium]
MGAEVDRWPGSVLASGKRARPGAVLQRWAGGFLCRITALQRGSGHCSVRGNALPVGSFAIRATYAGNADFGSSLSNIVRLKVVRA